jgi:hypothetical protein
MNVGQCRQENHLSMFMLRQLLHFIVNSRFAASLGSLGVGPWVLVSLATMAGCGDGRPPRVPVAGQVLIDGTPLGYGFVRFIPTGTRSSSGKLDEEGRFTLSCFESGDGAVVGTHQIEVAAAEPLSATRTRWHTPKKYASAATSGLQEQINGPTDSLVISLSWDGGKPFIESDSGGAVMEEHVPPGRRSK